MTRRARLAGAALLAAVSSCKVGTVGPEGGPPGGGGGLPHKGLRVDACRGGDGVLALSGAWAFRFETASSVSGEGLSAAQPEVATRYGVALMCQEGAEIGAYLVTCSYAQTRLADATGECAAQMPSAEVVASLPIAGMVGALDQDAPGARLRFEGFTEAWGLEAGASMPAEGALEAADAEVPDGVVDADDDGDPGVTLRGDGEVPTIAWAVRRTRSVFDLVVQNDAVLSGTTTSETDERILGGPAVRVLKGRTRAPAEGRALFVRADGLFGSARLDADGDRLLTCAELAPYLFSVLPPPAQAGCE